MSIHSFRASLVVTLALAVLGCGNAKQESAPTAQHAGLPAFFPADALRLHGPGELVLAEGKGGIELTLAEYNARVNEDPLPADLDTLTAQQSYLRNLVDFKVAAVEAMKRGHSPTSAATTVEAERELARIILQQNIRGATSIRDEQAREYAREHPGEFPRSPDFEDPGFLQHVKYTIQSNRLQTQLRQWRQREEVVIHQDRFDALRRGLQVADSSPITREFAP